MIDRVRLHDAVQRTFDITFAAVMLMLTSPLMLAVAVLVAWRLGLPVFFRQERPGLHGRTFTMVKFRTMRDVDPDRGLVTDADRITRLGRILRATSVDELPTFVNILRGDMSLVGPRPLLVCYLDRYSPEQARRHDVRPGITGLAQINGRNRLSWERRLELDVWYVENRSLQMNLRILLQTVRTVLRQEGIAAPNAATMTEFLGPTHPASDAATERTWANA